MKVAIVSSSILLVLLTIMAIGNIPSYGTVENVAVLVFNQEFSTLRPSLEQYVSDVASMSNFNVIIVNGSWSNHEDVRATLQNLYENSAIVGCILVGEIPWAYFNASSRYGETPFPSDLYYMDLDGQWVDENSDGTFDKRIDSDGVEIWISRIKPPIQDDNLLVSFFQKDHDYRAKDINVPRKCLMFQENNGQEWGETRVRQLAPLYKRDEITLFCLSNETSEENYASALNNPYEMVWVNSHAGPTRQQFLQPDGKYVWFDYLDAKNIQKGAIFYHLQCCETGRFDTQNYLSGWYLFGKGFGLGCLTSTTLYESVDLIEFIAKSSTEYLGEAFLEIVQGADSKAKYDSIYARDLYFGATLQGDPLLFSGAKKSPTAFMYCISGEYAFANCTVTFNATGSNDADGIIKSYCWDFGDRNITLVSMAIINHTYTSVGNYTVILNVTDNQNLWDTASCQVTITFLADLNQDGAVNMKDISYVARRFMCLPSDPLWDSIADLKVDGKIDMKDISNVARHFGEHI